MKTGSESERRPEKMKERKEIRKERNHKINYFVCVLMFFILQIKCLLFLLYTRDVFYYMIIFLRKKTFLRMLSDKSFKLISLLRDREQKLPLARSGTITAIQLSQSLVFIAMAVFIGLSG